VWEGGYCAIQTDVKEIGWEVMYWIHLVEGRIQWLEISRLAD
jgi:hypothetical protein